MPVCIRIPGSSELFDNDGGNRTEVSSISNTLSTSREQSAGIRPKKEVGNNVKKKYYLARPRSVVFIIVSPFQTIQGGEVDYYPRRL